jgi:hypothetical protein
MALSPGSGRRSIGGKVMMTMTGQKEMLAKLKMVASDKGMRKQARKALKEVSVPMLEEMKSRTPVKTGRLKRSERTWVMVSQKKEDMRISFLAGGPGIPYARREHEDTTLKHEKGGQAKFIESVMLERAGTLAHDIASIIDLAAATKGA